MNTPSTLLHALALAATLASPMAQAADATYNDEAAFVAAIQGGPGVPIIEGFESLEPRLRSLQPLSSPWFTLSSETTPMGVQDGSNSPEAMPPRARSTCRSTGPAACHRAPCSST